MVEDERSKNDPHPRAGGRELSRMIVAKLARLAGIGGPAVIAFFSPPYYPSVPPRENEITRAMSAALARQADAAALSRCAELVEAVSKVGFREAVFYPYISDLSYLQLDSEIEIESLAKNMPLFGLKDSAGNLLCSLDEEKLEDRRLSYCGGQHRSVRKRLRARII